MRLSAGAVRLPGWAPVLLCAGLGALAALGLAPNGLWALTLLALSVLIALATTARTPRRAALWLWAFGTGYFGLGLRWIVEPFQVEAEIFGWMAPFALVLMASGLALFWGAAGALAAWLGGGPRRFALALALAWSGAELARAYLFTGFPWAGLAQVWIDTPAAQLLAWIGPHGLGAATLGLAALPVWLSPPRALLAAPLPAALLALPLLALPVPPSPAPGPDAPVLRLVQPNAPQDEKWQPGKWQTFFWRQVEATRAPGRSDLGAPDLVIWPETAIPSLLEHSEEALGIIAEAARGTPVVLGALRSDAEGKYFNALAVLDPEGRVADIYDKHHLVPFGEYMPFPGLFRRLGIQALAQRIDTGFTPGAGPRLVDLPGVGQAVALICYEAVFPQNARSPGGRPRVLMQITNDAWFGLAAGPQQHLAQARMRAIEQGVPLVRAANTGISAVIDGQGRITASLGLDQHGFVDAPLPPVLPETLYARWGDGPAALLLLAAFAGLLLLRRRAA